jgi:oligoendopeptidase F
MVMTKKEIIKQLYDTSEWIGLVTTHSSEEEHIQDMLKGIENAISRLQMNVIEVDIAFYHPDDDETKKVYDIEGMTQEFEYKLDCIIKNAGL